MNWVVLPVSDILITLPPVQSPLASSKLILLLILEPDYLDSGVQLLDIVYSISKLSSLF